MGWVGSVKFYNLVKLNKFVVEYFSNLFLIFLEYS